MATETQRIAIILDLEKDKLERNSRSAAAALDRLRKKYDPLAAAEARLEKEQKRFNAALSAGTISAKDHADAMRLLQTNYDTTKTKLTGASAAVLAMNSATGAQTSFLQRNRSVMQQAGYQIGDFAVQVQGGQSALVAFSQQGSQMLGVFGPMGAVMGAVLSVGTILAGTLLTMGGSAGTASDKAGALDEAMSSLEGAISSYNKFTKMASASTVELYEEFGKFTVQIQGFQKFMAGVALADTFDALKATIAPLKGDLASLVPMFAQVADAKAYLASVPADRPEQMLQAREALEMYQDALVDAAAKMGVLPDQARALGEALDKIGTAKSLEETAVFAADALNLMESFVSRGEDLPEPLRQASYALKDMSESAASSAISADGIAAVDMAGNIASAANEAARLAENFRVALRAAASMASAQKSLAAMKTEFSPGGQALAKYGGRGTVSSAPVTDGNGFALKDGVFVDPSAKITRSSGGGSKRKSGGGGGSTKTETSIFETAQAQLETLNRQIEMLGKTKSEIAGLTASYKMLDEAKKRGLDLDKVQLESGQTLRDEINANAASVAGLTSEYESAQERAQFFSQAQDDVKNGLLDSIIEGKSFAGVLGGIAKAFARASLEAALFGSGPFSSGKSSGGGLLSGLIGGIFGGFRAGGGDVSSSKGYIVGENGPEWFQPSTSGTIVPNHALGASSGGGVTNHFTIQVNGARGNAEIREMVSAGIQQAAPSIAGAAVSSVQRKMTQSKSFGMP